MMKQRYGWLLLILLLPTMLFAETMLINQDSTRLYSNPELTGKPLIRLQKNTPVDLLRSNLSNGLSYVVTQDQQKGWLKTDNLTAQVAATETQALRPAYSWTDQVRSWFGAPSEKTTPVASVQIAPKSTQARFALTEDQVQQLQTQISQLQAGASNRWVWFAWGAGIVLIAFVIGFRIGRKRNRRSIFN